MEKYCMKLSCSRKNLEKMKNLGLRFLIKEYSFPLIILLSDDLDEMFNVFCSLYEEDYGSENISSLFFDYCRKVAELPVEYFEGFEGD